MQSRMDKYNTITSEVKSRTEKNKELYEEVRKSSLTEYEISSNMSVIDDAGSVVNVSKIKQILSDKYNDDLPKRKSIDIPEFENPVVEEVQYDTKEYDINAILTKAKQGKNIDYNKERLKKIRDAQYDILNNLDLELKKIEEPTINHKKKKEEEDLMNLINTITQIEKINKEKYSKEVSGALELLDLGEPDDSSTIETEIKEDIKEINKEDKVLEEKPEEIEETNEVVIEKTNSYDNIGFDEEEEPTEEHVIEDTSSKIDIDINKYDDFKDIDKRDATSIIIKIIIIVVILFLIVGAIFIINNILGLNLF